MFGLEFSYGGHKYAESGTVVVYKGNSAGLTLKETVELGVTYYNLQEINEIITYMGDFWHGKDYDPFRKNCNDFTQNLLKIICE
jgi:hypothetical protein